MIWLWTVAIALPMVLLPYLAGVISFRDGLWFLRRDV